MSRPHRPAQPAVSFGWRRRVPVGLLGMLALIVVVEAILAGQQTALTTIWADDWRRTATATGREARGCDLLIYGDSLVKFGVLPQVVADIAHLRTYNLAINAGTVPSEFFLLQRTLDSGVRPRAIVADFCPLMLPDDPRGSIRNYPELLTLRDLGDLVRTACDLDFGAAVLLGRLLPSLRCRHEIRDDLAALVSWRPGASRLGRNIPLVRGVWRRHRGAQPMPRAAVLPPADPLLLAGLTPARWTVDALNNHYSAAFLDLAERHGIPVFWVIPPLAPEVEAGRQARGTAGAYTRFVQTMQARHPSLVVVDGRGAGYDGTVHCDLLHLSDRGAAIFSADLARVVADHLAGRLVATWVDLPPVGGRAVVAGPAEGQGRATR